jgi:type I restriction enzyme, R subunit
LAVKYGSAQAVPEGFLVDFEQVNIRSQVRIEGLFLREGENVEVLDTESGLSRLDRLEDEREFARAEIDAKATAPDSTARSSKRSGATLSSTRRPADSRRP